MIDIQAAEQLLDLDARIGQPSRARSQLEGAVALHNILERHKVAYLADEVGMGKTYVALGTLALFRHYNPEFRFLVIAPQENLQHKWVKEYSNFVHHNIKFSDLRLRSAAGNPTRSSAACRNLKDFIDELVRNPRQDFFLRLTSFSMSLKDEKNLWREKVAHLKSAIPWLDTRAFQVSDKAIFKDRYAMALCCLMPHFDLVIFDEGHNIKHGFASGSSARNRVLAHAFGHPAVNPDPHQFPDYGQRADRLLLLSATPLEETYQHVWNQMDVFGHGQDFADLCRKEIEDEDKKNLARSFLIRRVSQIQAGNQHLTKNQYRREWREGGVLVHDEPIHIANDRQRLIVALIQKKVAELLASEKFGRSFQVGMLASFESFLETTKLKTSDDQEAPATFYDDDADGTILEEEREGIDVHDVNRIARDYRQLFGKELPHPKMDAIVDSLDGAWTRGNKSLVFVRRVASVKELQQKLNERYDQWLIDSLRERLPKTAITTFDRVVEQYRDERLRGIKSPSQPTDKPDDDDDLPRESLDEDPGGNETFFAWFFRGHGPKGVISGADLQKRFLKSKSPYRIFFEINHASELLGVPPGQVFAAICKCVGKPADEVRRLIQEKAISYLPASSKPSVFEQFVAAQGGTIEVLKDIGGERANQAKILWQEIYAHLHKPGYTTEAKDVVDQLEQRTFFTELRQRPRLQQALFPISKSTTFHNRLREQELRAELLKTAARLGHAFIDLYVLMIQRIGSLESGTRESLDEDRLERDESRIRVFLDWLEDQQNTPLEQRSWGAFDELSQIAQHFDLILDVNAPEARGITLGDAARYFGNTLKKQQPICGMSGKVNKTMVHQFRMPGYPFILVTTDLLKEGEDLHTFCSSVHHYGISWTPSSMEQRIGRIDRVRSQTARRLGALDRSPNGDDFLQVFYPYLGDTVEVLQVQRVLQRMDTFLRLMHEDLSTPKYDSKLIEVEKAIHDGLARSQADASPLVSAFPVPTWATQGPIKDLAVTPSEAALVMRRLDEIRQATFEHLSVEWDSSVEYGKLLGTRRMPNDRVQPFALHLDTDEQNILVRCVSPVGHVGLDDALPMIEQTASQNSFRIGAIHSGDDRTYDLTVEGDVVLGNPRHDVARIEALIARITSHADVLKTIHLPDVDQPLSIFRDDLQTEGDHYDQ
ncbi:MAG: DEAD/DEAH box helicase [Deltaproteobacteria bacterium]|nr:DEAD/DEAH box helicase [Deltaproteobacteria bacterium]MCB9488927.1 DEAD/DEAH box helicase [Deltaproteobacteria bacterium]